MNPPRSRRFDPHGKLLPCLVALAALGCTRDTGNPEVPASHTRNNEETNERLVSRNETVAATDPSGAAPPASPPGVDAVPGPRPVSLGAPHDGALRHAGRFPVRAVGLRSNPRRPNAAGDHATTETIGAVLRAAAAVDRRLPGSTLLVNDASLPGGGPIPHHGSHQNGRDVDVLFFLLDSDGAPFPSKGIPLDRRGRGFDFGDLEDPADDVPVTLDVARTWAFLEALAREPLLQRVFVAEHLRAVLVRHGRRAGADRDALARVEAVTCQPGTPHDDHLHLRFFCTAEDVAAGCVDTPPMYPWRRDALRDAGVEPRVEAPPRRTAERSGTSRARARAAAGPMHARVVEFLDRRETWARKPRTGRRWCR